MHLENQGISSRVVLRRILWRLLALAGFVWIWLGKCDVLL